MEEHLQWFQEEPFLFIDLPGVNWDYVAWNILEFFCLKQLLAEVEGGTLGEVASNPGPTGRIPR
jgi:hypothetical protein